MSKSYSILISGIPPLFVFSINWLLINGFSQDFYMTHPWVDIPLHFFGGCSIAMFAYLLLNAFPDKKKMINDLPVIIRIFLYVSIVSLAAVLWEFYEFIHDIVFLTSYQPNLRDTMTDLFLGLAGGLILAIYLVSQKMERASNRRASDHVSIIIDYGNAVPQPQTIRASENE